MRRTLITRRNTESVQEVPSRKMEDFKGCYTTYNQQIEITEVAGTWTIKNIKTSNTNTTLAALQRNNCNAVQKFKVTILTI